LLFMYALWQHAQDLCPRMLIMACARFLTVADIKGNAGATRVRKDVAQGSFSSPSADGRLFHRDAGLAARPNRIRIILWRPGKNPHRSKSRRACPESL
jgi:hypothetical protein